MKKLVLLATLASLTGCITTPLPPVSAPAKVHRAVKPAPKPAPVPLPAPTPARHWKWLH